MRKFEQRFHFFSRALFLDIFFDRRTRPIFIYALIIIGVGAALYHWLEGWSWLDSVYFVVITLTTIGYGDFSPHYPSDEDYHQLLRLKWHRLNPDAV